MCTDEASWEFYHKYGPRYPLRSSREETKRAGSRLSVIALTFSLTKKSKKQKVVAAELEVYSTELNNELNGNVDNHRISQLKCQITK